MRGARQPRGKPGEGNPPPFWMLEDDDAGRCDPRVIAESKGLWSWAYRYVGVVLHDAPSAAQLLEEVATDVSERLQENPEVARNLKGYLITAFHNRVLSELIRGGRITYEGLITELERKHRPVAPDWLGPVEIGICVRQIIPLMPPDARRVVHYRLLEFEWDEVAMAMEIEIEQAKNKYYYGIRTVWEALGLDADRKRTRRKERRDETRTD